MSKIKSPTGDVGRQDTFAGKLLTILLVTSIFMLNFLSRMEFGPLMPAIEPQIGLDHAQAGTMFLLITTGYFISIPFSGNVSSRIGHRRTVMLSSFIIGGILLAISMVNGPVGLGVGLLLLGGGAGLYLPSAITTITDLVNPRNWAKALAIHETAPNSALLLAPVLTELFLARSSWQTLVAVTGAGSIVVGIAFGLLGRGGDSYGTRASIRSMADMYRRPSLRWLILVFGLGVGGSLGIYSMLPLFLVNDVGMTREHANAVLAISRIAGLFVTFIAGWASDRIGLKKSMSLVLASSGIALVFLGLLDGTLLILAICLQAALSACFFPAAMAVVARVGKPHEKNLAVSCAIPLAFMGGAGLMPTCLGFAGEHLSFSFGIIAMGVLTVIGSFLVRFIRLSDE